MVQTVEAKSKGQSIAIVTGGTSGLGKALAKALVREGTRVCIVARRPDLLTQTAEELGQCGASSLALCADVSAAADVGNIRSVLAARGETVAEVYNVAGIGLFGPVDRATQGEVERVIATNLVGPINLVREFLDDLKLHRGTVVNVISRCALRGIANEAVYSASKWGLRGFSEALRVELAGSGVRIVSVYTGGMKTGFWNNWQAYQASPEYDSFMNPEDVARQIITSVRVGDSCSVNEINIARRA